MNVLAIGAHPDDIEIGCGGALALHGLDGDQVVVCCATDGEAGGLSQAPTEIGAVRRAEAVAGAQRLGVLEPRFLGFPDGQLADAGFRLVTALGRLVREERPALVYVHHPEDVHPDHAHLGIAAIDACRRAGADAFPELGPNPHRVDGIRLYEVWTPLHEVALGLNRYRSILLRSAVHVEAFGMARATW